MKIEVYTGCMADGIVVDGKHFADFSQKELDIFEKYVIDHLLKERQISIRELLSLIECDQEDWESEPCEQCGDTVVKKTYIL